MSGSYCGVRLGFYLLMVVAAVLFFVIQVIPAVNPSPRLKWEDCDALRQAGQRVIETALQTRDSHTGDSSGDMGLGGGGSPTDHSTGEQATGKQATGEDAEAWELAVASGECPAS